MDQSTLLIFLFFLYFLVGGLASVVAVIEQGRHNQHAGLTPSKAFLGYTAVLAAGLLWPFFASSLAQAVSGTAKVQFAVMMGAAIVGWLVGWLLPNKPVVARAGLVGGLMSLGLGYFLLGSSLTLTQRIVVALAAVVIFAATAIWPGLKVQKETA